jgi:hypothetical protein
MGERTGRDASALLIRVTAAWLAASTVMLVAVGVVAAPPNTRAVLLMGGGLVLLWVVGGGLLMRLVRFRARALAATVRADRRLVFVVSCTALALAEEAVTVTMTNLAPLFGVPVGAAYITASANYLDVVALHSVVVFVPMFAAWAFLLSRWDFSPNSVFLLFGVTGILAEAGLSPTAFLEFGLWIFVYGLMVWLPAFALPARPGLRRPTWRHYALAVVLPLLFAVPMALAVGAIHPVPIHFPPIAPNS